MGVPALPDCETAVEVGAGERLVISFDFGSSRMNVLEKKRRFVMTRAKLRVTGRSGGFIIQEKVHGRAQTALVQLISL